MLNQDKLPESWNKSDTIFIPKPNGKDFIDRNLLLLVSEKSLRTFIRRYERK